MRLLVSVLLLICKISRTYPRVVIASFIVTCIAGFSLIPLITISTNLMSGVGHENPIINLTMENTEIFGEQDALIVVLEFPEPPGDFRLPVIKDLGEGIAQLPGVRRVRYRFLDPENYEEVTGLFKHFLLGMNERERERVRRIFSPEGLAEALRRNRNRLFLTENPYLQKRILEDPLELGQFVAKAMETRVGSVSLGDTFLLIAAPDSTVYLIQVTPEFPSSDILKGKHLVDLLRKTIPERIAQAAQTIPGFRETARDLKWSLTGKTVFQYESDMIFDRENLTIILCSFGLVVTLLLTVYRSVLSALILMTPLAAGIGPNYGIIHLTYDEVNPVVMGATGVLLGLGAEYGEHIWGRIREEIDRGTEMSVALTRAYEQTGPPVLLGGVTGVAAFLCLCLSNQPALAQFGYFGATGLVLTMLATLFLIPALFTFIEPRGKDCFPVVKVDFTRFSGLSERRPVSVVAVSVLVVAVSLVFVPRVSTEKDLFKVFLAGNMESMAVSERISKKFHSNFSQPTFLSFDVEDLQEGLAVQRRLDLILERLMRRDGEIASFDSISYLMAPDEVRAANRKALASVTESWNDLKSFFSDRLRMLDLSSGAVETMNRSFDSTGKILSQMPAVGSEDRDEGGDPERAWYVTRVNGKHRLLTIVRYSDSIADPDELAAADKKILEAVKDLPVKVSISGTRQAMEAILSSLVSDLVKLGSYAFVSVMLIFCLIFPRPLGVALCLVPMIGAFIVTLGAVGALGLGVPFSIVCVAPLIFGFGIHSAIHVVMGSMHENGGSVARAVARVTPRAMVTSLTIIMGFVSMLTSDYYAIEFLGTTMIIGMVAAVPLTLATLPALVVLMERRRSRADGA